MDPTVLLQIVLEIIKMVMDKSSKAERLAVAADLQAVAVETGDPTAKLIARAAMCAANTDEAGQKKLFAMVERFSAIAAAAEARKVA